MKTLAEMTAETREVSIAKGHRTGNPFGDYVALLHSEISEALEAFRDHGLADATRPICGNEGHTGNPCPEHGMGKPEGVGSEFADILIRLLDMADVFGLTLFDMDMEIGDVSPLYAGTGAPSTFGGSMAWLHARVSGAYQATWDEPASDAALYLTSTLRALVAVAERYGIDLAAEYERKLTYNRTRAFQHGGRSLAGKEV